MILIIMVFICISLMVYEVEHLFFDLLAIYSSPLLTCLFVCFVYFLIGFFKIVKC